ncbi:MAG: AhpC/TSA family protein [Leptolyngbya sp. RL_3_1]|nr:AhpC/TSA family protein [Leptolyngbya sp. RL_3_1]
MSLTQDLADFKAQFRQNVPADTQSIMAQAGEAIAALGLEAQSLQLGDTLPAITLPNATGEAISLDDRLRQGPLVIAFYRGGWCPYCNLELRALQQALPQIQALGAQLVAITPETPDNSLSTQEKNELTFEVLSDRGNQVARQLGLVFTLPETLRPLYANFGIDLPATNGDDTFELPVPATYVIGAEGKVIHRFVNTDYTQREDPERIVAILQQMPAAV